MPEKPQQILLVQGSAWGSKVLALEKVHFHKLAVGSTAVVPVGIVEDLYPLVPVETVEDSWLLETPVGRALE